MSLDDICFGETTFEPWLIWNHLEARRVIVKDMLEPT